MALDTRSSRLRMSVLGAVAIALFAALFARVWYLQVVSEQEFSQQAADNRVREIIEQAPRGRILDVKGRVLVDNRPSIVVTIDKETLLQAGLTTEERDELFLRLATEISASGRLTKVADIEAAFESNRYGPFAEVPVVRDISEDLQVYLAEHAQDFPGVNTDVVTVREYPYGTLAAHVLGYVGPLNDSELAAVAGKEKTYQPNDEIGKGGVEAFFEDQLRGTPGRRVVEVDKFNNILAVREETPPQAGSDLRLTIDIDVQALVEQELRLGLERARQQPIDYDVLGIIEYRAPAGAMVLMDPRDGAVRAMASYPTYDPGAFVNGISAEAFAELNDPDNDRPLLNRAIQGEYAPGSTFKPFSAYAGLDTGMIGSRGILGVRSPYLDEGVFFVPGCEADSCRFQNAGAEVMGPVDLPRSLAVSSDTYYYNLAYNFDVRRGFDQDSIQKAAVEFGYGTPSGVTLPNESPGRMPTPDERRRLHEEAPEAFPDPEWRTGDTIITSIGQGDVLATPMQIANSYATIANGGSHFAPGLADAVLDPITGEVEQEYGPRLLNEIYFPDEFRDPIVEGLVGAVAQSDGTEDGGTATRAFESVGFPLGTWPVAGKTGTSEKLGPDGIPLADFAMFAAFGPVTDPQWAGVVVLEEAGFGGNVAAPIFATVLNAIVADDVPRALTLDEVADGVTADADGEADAAGEAP